MDRKARCRSRRQSHMAAETHACQEHGKEEQDSVTPPRCATAVFTQTAQHKRRRRRRDRFKGAEGTPARTDKESGRHAGRKVSRVRNVRCREYARRPQPARGT